MEMTRTPGAVYTDPGHVLFTVWAPAKQRMVLHIVQPVDQKIEMCKDDEGYFSAGFFTNAKPVRYFFQTGGDDNFPDPASQCQPEGVHGPSEVVDHTSYQWRDHDWKGLPFDSLIFYEVHVGTFTAEGTFEAIIPRLDELADTGINAIELMPVAQFPGSRNWGYDGVYPYAVQFSYGGITGLKKLVDACHNKGIAIFLDVIYNHLGPEGNYLSHFGPYFTGRYSTPWGDAINYDGEWSDGVRDYFSGNVLHWLKHFHFDGLRLDAIHMVFDYGAVHFWELVHARIKKLETELQRPLRLIAESDFNAPRVVQAPHEGGYGFDAQWLDDFHHALYVMLDSKGRDRYYDFGTMEQLAKALTEGFVHSGEYVKFRKRKHGRSSAAIPGNHFIIFNANHDQVGNRVGGERLCMLVNFEKTKLAAAALLLSPYIPLLFMGEEYADDTPFFYFVSHSNEALIEAVREGRAREFKDFGFDKNPPDPQDPHTFATSKLQWEKRQVGHHQVMLQWHRQLIRMRREYAPLRNFNKKDVMAEVIGQKGFALCRRGQDGAEKMLCLFNLSDARLGFSIPGWIEQAVKVLDSTEKTWARTQNGDVLLPRNLVAGEQIVLPPESVAVYYSGT